MFKIRFAVIMYVCRRPFIFICPQKWLIRHVGTDTKQTLCRTRLKPGFPLHSQQTEPRGFIFAFVLVWHCDLYLTGKQIIHLADAPSWISTDPKVKRGSRQVTFHNANKVGVNFFSIWCKIVVKVNKGNKKVPPPDKDLTRKSIIQDYVIL